MVLTISSAINFIVVLRIGSPCSEADIYFPHPREHDILLRVYLLADTVNTFFEKLKLISFLRENENM